jgi:hypothetical protein
MPVKPSLAPGTPLLLLLMMICSFCQTNREEPDSKSITVSAGKNAAAELKKKWQASPDGVKYRQWEDSPEGRKVRTSYNRVKKQIRNFAGMEAVISSLTFERDFGKSAGPKWIIVKISGDDYMMQFTPKEFQKLNSLRVNDTIMVKSRSAGFSPNHPFLILSGDYMEKNGKILFERHFGKQKPC